MTTESAAIPTLPAFTWTMFKANDRTLILDGKGAVIGGSAFPGDCTTIVNAHNADLRAALAATPALPVPGGRILTDERIEEIAEDYYRPCSDVIDNPIGFGHAIARAIEADLRAALAAPATVDRNAVYFIRNKSGICNGWTECSSKESHDGCMALGAYDSRILYSAAPTMPQPARTGKPYLDGLIDRLLMPPNAMVAADLRKLHQEAAEMLHMHGPAPEVAQPVAHGAAHDDFARGYFCAVSVLLRETSTADTHVKSLFSQGGNGNLAAQSDIELFREHGLIHTPEEQSTDKPAEGM